MYIAITGNIGCGKTSLTRILSERTGAKAYFEESDNPYIGDFYEDMNRWSFKPADLFSRAAYPAGSGDPEDRKRSDSGPNHI